MIEIEFDIKDQVGVRATWPDGGTTVSPCGNRQKAEEYADKLRQPGRRQYPDEIEIVEREKMVVYGPWQVVK